MKLNRRDFVKLTAGVFGYASSYSVLAKAGIADTKPITLVNVLDKTGPINIYCLKQIEAVAMAAHDINAAGGLLGRKIQVIFYDSQSKVGLASQYATRAFVNDGADVLQGGLTSSAREVIRPVVRRFDGLYFYNAIYEGGVCDRRTVCTGMVPTQQLEPLVQYVSNERNAKTHYILAADYNYGHITAKWLQKLIRENGGETQAVEFFPLSVSNFAEALSRIQRAKPDALWSVLVGQAQIGFYGQFQSTIGKDNMTLIGTVYGTGRENTTVPPEVNDGILIGSSFFDSLPSPAAQDFVKHFQDFTGEHDYVGEYAEMGYRGVMLWAEAARKAGAVDPDKVIPALGGTQINGAGGLYTIEGQTNHVIMNVHIAQGNRDQGFDLIKTFPQRHPTFEESVCNLHENPNSTKQYVPQL